MIELRPIRHKIIHFGDILRSQFLGLVPKKLETNATKAQKQTYIRNRICYNIKLTLKNYSQVWSPPTTSGLVMERVHSGRSR